MNQKDAEKFLEVLEPLRSTSPRIDAMHSDVLNVYYPKIVTKEWPTAYTTVWDASLLARLKSMPTGSVDKPIAYVPKSGDAVPRILFGQIRIAADFQGSATTNQAAIVGFPHDQVVGRPLAVVAGMINNQQIGADAIPVQIFLDQNTRAWVAVNNRGHAVHCLAGVTPLRLYPRFPEQVEINRLKDQEGKGDIPNFTYDPTLTTRLANRPHTVPSTQIPITDGPNSWVVRAIATVP